jgi:uncharacterized HAD superfamily protein
MITKIKIGIDIDEVLANHLEKLNEFYYEKTGQEFNEEDYNTYNWWEVWDITKEEAIEIDKEFKRSTFFREILPVDETVDIVKQLSLKNELFIITSRSIEIKELTLNWFFNHFEINLPIIHSGDFWGSNKSKAQICEELGVSIFIEDHPVYALDCAKNGIKTFLLDKPWNRNYEQHENLIKVQNWKEIIERLEIEK